MSGFQSSGYLIAHDLAAPGGGREVLYVLTDGRRIPVVITTAEYSPETVQAIGAALVGRDRRQPTSKGGRPQRAAGGR